MSKSAASTENEMRLDKWLWCARFFKSRSLAAEAARAGRIKCNGKTARPSSPVRPGDCLEISTRPWRYTVDVKDLAKTRGPALQACKLYIETAQSLADREALTLQMKANRSVAGGQRRPDKRERRKIIRFTRRQP